MVSGSNEKEEEVVDIFNSESPLFSDICIPYTD